MIAAALAVLCAWTCAPPHLEWRRVFAEEAWYRARSEREREFHGTLQRRAPAESPNARTALRYSLDGLPIYAPSTDALEPFVGCAVVIRGKEVDLSGEGFGKELWPGAIAFQARSNSVPAPAASARS